MTYKNFSKLYNVLERGIIFNTGAMARLQLESKPKIKSRKNKIDGDIAATKRWRIQKTLYA